MFSELKKFNFKNKLNPKKIANYWKIAREQRLAILIIIGGVFFVWFYFRFLISLNIESIIAYRKDISALNEKLYELQKINIAHPDIKAETNILKTRFKEVKEDFPRVGEFLTLAQHLLKELENRGIKIVNFKYLYDLNISFPQGLREYGLELELVTDYLTFAELLEKVEQEGFKFVVSNIKISKLGNNNVNVKFQMNFILRS